MVPRGKSASPSQLNLLFPSGMVTLQHLVGIYCVFIELN